MRDFDCKKLELGIVGGLIDRPALLLECERLIEQKRLTHDAQKAWEFLRWAIENKPNLEIKALLSLVKQAKSVQLRKYFDEAAQNYCPPYEIVELCKMLKAEHLKQDIEAEKLKPVLEIDFEKIAEKLAEIKQLEEGKADMAERISRAMSDYDKPFDPLKLCVNFNNRLLFKKRDICTIGARPGVGKTIFAINSLKGLLDEGKKVLLYSTESGLEEILHKYVAIEANLRYWDIITHRLSAQDVHEYNQSLKRLIGKKEQFIQSAYSIPTLEDIRREMAEYSPDVVIIDNLSGIDVKQTYDNISLNYKEFLARLKEFAIKYDAFFLLLSHLTRLTDKEKNAMPTLASFSYSVAIEQISTQCIGLWCEHTDDTHKHISWKILKNRDGLGDAGTFYINRKNLYITEAQNETLI